MILGRCSAPAIATRTCVWHPKTPISGEQRGRSGDGEVHAIAVKDALVKYRAALKRGKNGSLFLGHDEISGAQPDL